MSLDNRRTPERQNPFFSQVVIQKGVTVSKVLTTGGGVVTGTAAELLAGLLVFDTQNAQTYNLPTAALLNAAIPGVEVGSFFEFEIINYGASTFTLGLGTGVTKTTIAGVAGVMTIVTLAKKRFRLECTGVLSAGSSSDAWVVWAYGSVAAAVA